MIDDRSKRDSFYFFAYLLKKIVRITASRIFSLFRQMFIHLFHHMSTAKSEAIFLL